jgi:hypothetical protein
MLAVLSTLETKSVNIFVSKNIYGDCVNFRELIVVAARVDGVILTPFSH